MNESENPAFGSSNLTAGKATSTTVSSSALEELRAEYRTLRNLFHLALAALFLFTAGVNLYLLRQVISVGKDLTAHRPRVTQMVSDFEKNGQPLLQQFVSNLQTYAKTHPDFNPILIKYNLAQPSGAISPVPATPPVK